MKKTSIIVLVIASVMLLASCGGVNEFNTPKDVIGEWKGSTSEAVDTSTVDANDYAGTYTYAGTIKNPDYTDYKQDYTSASYTARYYYVPLTNDITASRTVKDDYSYTEEVKVLTTVAARAIQSSTSSYTAMSAQTDALKEWKQASKTVTRKTTVTVTPNDDGSFLETTSVAYTIVADHDYFWEEDSRIGNRTVSATPITTTTTVTQYVNSEDYLSYKDAIKGELVYKNITHHYYDSIYDEYDQNYYTYNDGIDEPERFSPEVYLYTMSKEDAPTVTTTYTSQHDYNLVVGEDGTFTLTTTDTKKFTAPEEKEVVVKNVYTGMATGSGDGYLTLNTKKAVYTPAEGDAVTKEFNDYVTYDYYIVNKTLQIDGMPTLTFVEPAKK